MPRELPLCPPGWVDSAQRQNCRLSLSFGRPIDRAAWKNAWEILLRRHPILRTTVARGGASLLEADRLDTSWNEPDWSHIEPAELPTLWQELQAREAVERFTPGAFPAWRLHLIQLPNDHSHLLWTIDPLLLDEVSAGQLLVEWFYWYDLGAGIPETITPTVSPSAALGAAELPESSTSVTETFAGLSRWAAHPFWFEGREGAPRQQKSIEIPPATREKLAEFCAAEGVGLGAVVSALWAGLLANWNASGESLISVLVDLRPFLPAECSDLRGRLSARVPYRFRSQPESSAWLSSAARSVEQLAAAAFTPWRAEAQTAAQRLLLPSLPVSTVCSQPRSLNDQLHTAFPRWLGADARWQETPLSPVILRLVGEQRPMLVLEWEEPWFEPRWAEEILQQLLQGLSSLPDVATWPVLPKPERRPDFQLQALPDPGTRLTNALRNSQATAECGTARRDAAQLLAGSNRWLRYLRKQRPAPEARLLVSLPVGWDLLELLLALVRDRVDFLYVSPEQLRDLTTEDFSRLRAGILLSQTDPRPEAMDAVKPTDASGEARTESSPKPIAWPKILVLDEIREKVASLPEGNPGERKVAAEPCWSFLQPDGTEQILRESQLGEAWAGLVEFWPMDGDTRMLWPLETLQPHHLVELCALVQKSGCLLLAERELFASRSDFEEELSQRSVTHLSLTGARWSDWMQYSGEVDSRLSATLQHLLLEAGTFSPFCLQRWNLIAQSVLTTAWFSPTRLPGLGLHQNFPAGQFSARPLLPLGQPDPGLQTRLVNQAGKPLPPGLVGRLRFEGSSLGAEGAPGVTTNLQALEVSGLTWAADSPDGLLNLPWPSQQHWLEKLSSLPEVLDGLIEELDCENGALRAWLVLRGRPSGLSPELAQKLQGLFSTPPLQEVALVPRWPLDASGRLSRERLPATQPLAQWIVAPVKKPAASAPAQVTASQRPAETPDLELVWNRTVSSGPQLLVFVGVGAPPTHQTNWVSALEAALDPMENVGYGRLGRPAGVLSSAWLDAASMRLRGLAELALIARGAAVWDVVRLAHWLEKAGAPPAFLYLFEPTLPELEILQTFGEKVKSAFRWFGPKNSNARREAPAAPRLVPIHIPCKVLLPEGETVAFENLLLQADYYAADLSSTEKALEALLALIFDPATPAEEEDAAESSEETRPAPPTASA